MSASLRAFVWCVVLMLSMTAVALAASRNGIVITQDGRETIATKPAPRHVFQEPDAMQGLVRLYDNSSDYPLGVYWCCNGWTISGSGSPAGTTYAEAMPFSPSVNATVQVVGLAVGYVSGTNEITVSLNADNNGIPGNSLASVNVSNLPSFGSCCKYALANFTSGAPVSAGTQYWVVVQTTSPTSDTQAAWNDNDTNQTFQPFAYYSNGAWSPTEGFLGAFAVAGAPQ